MPMIPMYRPGGDTIAELLMRQGDAAARAAERSAMLWGNAVSNIGNIAGNAVSQYQEQKNQERQSQLMDRAITSWDGSDARQLYRGFMVAGVSAPEAIRMTQGITAIRNVGLGKEPDENDFKAVVGTIVAARKTFGDEKLKGIWQQQLPVLEKFRSKFLPDLGMVTEYTPQVGDYFDNLFSQQNGGSDLEKLVTKDATGAETIQWVRPKQGQTFTSAAPPAKPENLSAEGAFIRAQYGDKPTAQQLLEGRSRFAAAGREPDRPQATRFTRATVMVGGKPVLANYDSASGRYFDVNTGKTLSGIDPAGEGSNTNKFSGAIPALQAIGELSAKINTQQGITAKISGAAERAKAQANMADDVAEYQAVVMSFTPLLARMMGHTGVLTEQDVVSTRQILPKPEDSKSVRDRKMKRIEAILGGQAGMVTATPTEPPSGPQPIKDANDYTDLPSGSEYIDPKGVRRRKR